MVWSARSARTFIAALAMSGLLASACAAGTEEERVDATGEGAVDGDVDEESGEDDGAGDGADGAAVADGQPLRLAVPGVPGSLDPAVFEGDPSSELQPFWAGPLLRYQPPEVSGDTMPGPDEVEPFIAESVETEDDGSLLFTLRDAVSPYGNTITSEDVQWSLERLIELDGIGGFLMSVAGVDTEDPVEIIDDRQFRLNVVRATNFALPALTWYSTSPLDSTELRSHATDDDPWAQEWLAENSAGFGPYQVDGFVSGEQLTLTANPNWIGEPVGIDQLVLRSVADSGTRLQLIESGEVEYANALLYDHVAALEGNDAVRLEPQSATIDALALNFDFEPFADERVRRAIALAIDRDAIIQGAYQGFGEPALSHIASGIPQPEPSELLSHDPDAARELLEDAGYGEGFAFTLTVSPARPGPHVESAATLLQAQLAEVGLEVGIETVAGAAEYQEGMAEGRYEAYVGIQRPLVLDPAYATFLVHGTGGAINDHGYSSGTVDELISELLETEFGPEWDELVRDLQDELMADTPWVPMVEVITPRAFAAEVDGFRPYPNNIIYPWELMWR